MIFEKEKEIYMFTQLKTQIHLKYRHDFQTARI